MRISNFFCNQRIVEYIQNLSNFVQVDFLKTPNCDGGTNSLLYTHLEPILWKPSAII